MPPSRPVLSLARRAAFAGCLLAAATLLAAAEGGFITTLSPEQQTAAGLSTLAPAERAALDQLVASEMSESRLAEGKVLSGTFVSRRTETERREAGLDRLSAAELARLDELIVNALLSRPKPKERPRLKDDDIVSARIRPEVHGSLSLTYGWSGGRDFRGAELWLDYFIPEIGLSLGFGLTRYSGGFFQDYYPGRYDSRHSTRDPFLFDASRRSLLGDDFAYGSGESFRAATSWGSIGYSRRRY